MGAFDILRSKASDFIERVTSGDVAAPERETTTFDAPDVAEKLAAPELAPVGLFDKLIGKGIDATVGSLQVARGAYASLRGGERVPTIITPTANHDHETAPAKPAINIVLFQFNVNNEKGPGFTSKVVNSLAGAAASFASAREATQEAPAHPSTISAKALGLAFSAIKFGKNVFAK